MYQSQELGGSFGQDNYQATTFDRSVQRFPKNSSKALLDGDEISINREQNKKIWQKMAV
jgi:hypothetical protein